jgi:hypothetical protein|tara:strand:- start:5402 stop:5611 length:210 start_codon:yes stop_codon:yes gene_type:complete
MPLPEIPYDPWFNDKPHPHDSMPIATDEPLDLAPSSVEPQDEEDIHEKMYQEAIKKHSPWLGGSENFHK